ncbi:MAG: M20/M25/M40 family metallo-hydrolase [Candidatus Heimdallarchaeota archaeon]|nr:M20/M25/M40 family metallo-hydrolase [Candidatus Heimdallarchaeota archaeon]MCK5048068.1 M20/M25/M40 family metallo-hydrolase [Candidatus Heimdallarchaeota archaeon]
MTSSILGFELGSQGHLDRIYEILKELIHFNTIVSDTTPIGIESDLCAKFIANILEEAGFGVLLMENEGYPLVLALNKGSGDKVLHLSHFDVVPVSENWSFPPLVLTPDPEGDLWYGRGSADMKGSVAAILSIAPLLNRLTNIDLKLAFTSDEEIGGTKGALFFAEYLDKQGKRPDMVITGDANGLEIITKRRNTYTVYVSFPKNKKTVSGKMTKHTFDTVINSSATMHAAYFILEEDKHCLFEAAKDYLAKNDVFIHSLSGSFLKTNVLPSMVEVELITSDGDESIEVDLAYDQIMKTVNALYGLETPCPGSNLGTNCTPNMIKETEEEITVSFDVRSMCSEVEPVELEVNKLLGPMVENYSLKVLSGISPINTDHSSDLVKTAIQVAGELNFSTVPAERGGATDGRFFAKRKIPSIDFGPLGGNIHADDEFVVASTLIDASLFYLRLFEKLNNEK